MSVNPTLDNTWGAALIGLVVASILYGMTTLQAYIYYTRYPNDVRGMKLLVLVVWILDTVSLCLVINAMYTYLVSDMFSPFRLLIVNRTLNVDPAIMGILAFLTHSYLGIRVWRVCNRNKLLAVILAVLSLAALGLSLAASIISFRFKLWTQKVAMKPLALAGTILVVVLDAVIASVLCIYLYKQKAQGRDLRRVVHRVCLFAINTGLASSVMSTVNVVTFVAFPDTMIFLGSNFIFTKVYANCLLANLNVRESLGRIDQGTLSLNLSALRDPTISAIVYREAAGALQSSVDETISPDQSKEELDSHSTRV